MKRFVAAAVFLCAVAVLSGCAASAAEQSAEPALQAAEDDREPEETFELLTAEITDDSGEILTVCPLEGEWERTSTDAIFVSKSLADESIRPFLTVGTTVVIQYDGRLMETYPCQINGEKMWIESISDDGTTEPE